LAGKEGFIWPIPCLPYYWPIWLRYSRDVARLQEWAPENLCALRTAAELHMWAQAVGGFMDQLRSIHLGAPSKGGPVMAALQGAFERAAGEVRKR